MNMGRFSLTASGIYILKVVNLFKHVEWKRIVKSDIVASFFMLGHIVVQIIQKPSEFIPVIFLFQ